MSAQPKLNISSIIGIKEGIYQVFALIDQNLEVYSQHPGNASLIKDCCNYIHQLDGLLEMLGLSSSAIVTEKMEQLVEALINKKIAPSQPIFDALKQSTKALLYYLNEMIDGAEENPLRLFPAYRGLMQVYGFENAPESDLFFPRLTANPSLKAEAAHIDAFAARILAKQLGTEYQAGLLKWLRDPSNQTGVQQMAASVNQIEAFPGTTEARAFWWVAAGFLEDLLQREGSQIDLPVRRLCGKIEQAIRHLAAETPGDTSLLMRELLYHIAHSESGSQRISAIKSSYTWPGQAQDEDTPTFEQSEAMRPVLEMLRSTLMQANDIWREFCAGHQESLTSLLQYVDWLDHQARQTGCAPLEKLIDAIGGTVAYLHDQPQDTSEELAMEVAAALLLIESILDDFYKLPADLPQQIDVIAARLNAVATGELLHAPAFAVRESKTQDQELLAQVAQEILTNLGQIESILDKFFFEPAERSELPLLPDLFKQIFGILAVLDLERAHTLLHLCRGLIEKLLKPGYEIVETEQILLADGLSSLGFYIEALRSGQPDSHQIIEEAIKLFQIAPNPASKAASTAAAEPAIVVQADTVFSEAVSTVAVEAAFEAGMEAPGAVPQPSVTVMPAQPVQAGQPAPLANEAVDRINLELLAVFLEETHDIIAQMGGKLRAWRMLPQDEDIHHALLRLLHTLKGSARMAGALQLGDLIHAMESHVETAFRERNISDAALDWLESEFDVISGKIEQLQRNAIPSAAANQEVIDIAVDWVASASGETDLLQSKTVLRINSELIDRMVNDSGEVGVLRSKIEAQLENFKQSLQDLTESTNRLHDQLREVEIQAETHMQSHLAQQHESGHAFDPLEFDRFSRFQELPRLMAESVGDIITVQKSLRATHAAAEEAVAQQAAINRQLQQSLLQIRTIPFSNYAERYYRIARQVAEDMGKKANLEITGVEVEVDRSILEKINPPLEHLLRNAIAHGIEEPAQRRQAGKSATGQVAINLRQEGNEVIITLSDDGRGLNLPRIREEAQRLGLIRENEALDDDKVMSLIFMQGLSTVDLVTGIAGRGIGLDIVKNEISMLGGRISVQSVPHQGTIFTINLPLMLSVAQTLMVRAGKQIYAIPAFIVEHHSEIGPETLEKAYQDHRIALNGKTYPFLHLSHLLDEPGYMPEAAKEGRVLFLHSGTQYLAVHVDELTGNAEVVVKNTGSQLAHAPGVEGATITGDGEVILILNPVKLIQRGDAQKALSTPVTGWIGATQKKPAAAPVVMVVDDSLTVRRVTCRLLEREGCDVLIAKNGAEAVEILQETTPDVMLIDLEMPKMNGFELIKKVRASPETTHIPIIIISSRTAEKHRKIAKDLGVDVFLGKPYKEDELLSRLSAFVNK